MFCALCVRFARYAFCLPQRAARSLQDINALVKVKNPSLLLQLQKTPPRLGSFRR